MGPRTATSTCSSMETPGRSSPWTACLWLITTRSGLCVRLVMSYFRRLHAWRRSSPAHRLGQTQHCAVAVLTPVLMVIQILPWSCPTSCRLRLRPDYERRVDPTSGLLRTSYAHLRLSSQA